MATSGAPLRIALCGLGFMGRTHFGHLVKHPQVRVVALCDKNPDRRLGRWQTTGNIGARDAERVDLSPYRVSADPLDAARADDVDVVVVTLPTPHHATAAVAALEAGKHVFCEKPMGRSLDECDRMLAAARASGRTLMVGQCIRFWPQYEIIRQQIEAGRIGRVQFATLRRLSNPPRFASDNWYMDHTLSGGALLDLHVHDVDYVADTFGTPTRIRAAGSRGPSGGIDHVLATWDYDDGRYVAIEGGWSFHAPFPFEMAITVRGETGTLEWVLSRGPEVRLYDGAAEPELLSCPDGTGWSREMDYLIECLRAGRPVARCQPESSRQSIALALLEREAVETGREMVLSEALGDGC